MLTSSGGMEWRVAMLMWWMRVHCDLEDGSSSSSRGVGPVSPSPRSQPRISAARDFVASGVRRGTVKPGVDGWNFSATPHTHSMPVPQKKQIHCLHPPQRRPTSTPALPLCIPPQSYGKSFPAVHVAHAGTCNHDVRGDSATAKVAMRAAAPL